MDPEKKTECKEKPEQVDEHTSVSCPAVGEGIKLNSDMNQQNEPQVAKNSSPSIKLPDSNVKETNEMLLPKIDKKTHFSTDHQETESKEKTVEVDGHTSVFCPAVGKCVELKSDMNQQDGSKDTKNSSASITLLHSNPSETNETLLSQVNEKPHLSTDPQKTESKEKTEQVDEHASVSGPVVNEGIKLNSDMNQQDGTKVTKNLSTSIKLLDGNRNESNDLLFPKINEIAHFNTKCSEKVCLASVRNIPSGEKTPRTMEKVLKDAELFLREYYSSIKLENSDGQKKRLEQVKRDLKEKGTYQLDPLELVFGAKLAWRNATRCIGRIQWKKLQVFDCREVTTSTGMFEALCNHIKYATNKGNIRSAISIFRQRTDSQHDYRIWNRQLIAYAGYQEPDGRVIGDPINIEFTEICVKLGWKAPRTSWDILPLVLSVNGKDPDYFDLPREIVMEVKLEHPSYDWFKDLGLKWYAVPLVSNMKFDCGGLDFTACAFNGWYMGTEIGCRNICDVDRLNAVENVAKKMGMNINSSVSLWKDKALVEVNIAVLHSFLRDHVTIVDHHSASDQFQKHLENETKSRGGCPADWIWIVPPLSSSLSSLFHQEMATYYLRPSFDYQQPVWKSSQWIKYDFARTVHKKFHFKDIIRGVKFSVAMYRRALAKRIKATILYATETGNSERYAKALGTIFSHAFNVHVQCMANYEVSTIDNESLVLIVASTFGNGEPPANGQEFAKQLVRKLSEYNTNQAKGTNDPGAFKMPTPKTLMRTNCSKKASSENKKQAGGLKSNKSSVPNVPLIEPLSNVSFAVFGLGSSAYPKFCNFGKRMDKILGDLGGERILEMACGDELLGQEQQFRAWSSQIFQVACRTFCLDDNDMIESAKKALINVPTEETVRFEKILEEVPMKTALENCLKKQLIAFKVNENKILENSSNEHTTIFVDLKTQTDFKYDPGDHVAVFPCNRKEIVDAVLNRMKDADNKDEVVQLQVMKKILLPKNTINYWEKHEKLPATTIRQLFTRFLDITTPPSTTLLKYLAEICSDKKELEQIQELVNDSNKYDDWRYNKNPHLAEVLAMFPSCRPQTSLIAALLPSLQPRYYSISSSPLAHPNSVHITCAVVIYKTEHGKGPKHYGVCSTYLQGLKPNDEVFAFIGPTPSFHMPKDISTPLILVGPGTGIAPFRGFWHHRRHQISKKTMKNLTPNLSIPGPMWLFFGCRTRNMDLYKDEKDAAVADGILSKSFVALSREKDVPKTYVQHLMEKEGAEISKMIVNEGGHLYVCGDCRMAEDVLKTLKKVIQEHAKMTVEDAEQFILSLMNENKYHEDVFGITLKTAKVRSESRELAKKKDEKNL